jgi:hypothetical protein
VRQSISLKLELSSFVQSVELTQNSDRRFMLADQTSEKQLKGKSIPINSI